MHELLLAPTTRLMLEVVARNPVLLGAPAARLIGTLADRADTGGRRERIDDVSSFLSLVRGIVQTAVDPDASDADKEILDPRAVHETAAVVLAARCAELRRSGIGLAWAGATVALGQVLNDMVPLGHELATGRIAEVAREAAVDLGVAAALFAAAGSPRDSAHADLARAWLLHAVPSVRAATGSDDALVVAVRAVRNFTRGSAKLLAARARHLAGILYRDRQAGDLIRNQERGIRHLSLAWETFRSEGEFGAGAHVLFSACDGWVSRAAGEHRENVATGYRCYRAARAIWIEQDDLLSVLRADYLWASCLCLRRFDRAAALEGAIRLLERVRLGIDKLPAAPQAARLRALAASLLGEATRERTFGRRKANLLRAAGLQAEAAASMNGEINPRDLASAQLRLAVTAIDLVEHEGSAWIGSARTAVDLVLAIPEGTVGPRTRLVAMFWDGLVAAYEGAWDRAAAVMLQVASNRALLLRQQRAPMGLSKITELLSGLAAMGTYIVYRSAGVATAMAFLADVRRPIMAGNRRQDGATIRQEQWDAAADAVIVPLVTPLGSVIIGMHGGGRGRSGQPFARSLPGLRPASLRRALRGWLRACHRARHDRAFMPSEYLAALERLLRPLGRKLGRPLARMLAEAGVLPGALVATVPIGPLTMIPLHALSWEDGTFLGDRWTMVNWPWLGSYGPAARPPPSVNRRGLVVCDPDGSLGRRAEVEAAAVCSVLEAAGLEVERLDGPAGSARSIASRMAGAEVVHIIAHATFDFLEPGRSGIIDSRGRVLTAGAISTHVDLSACRLCVLSACDTGLSDPGLLADSFVGLTGAFLEAGAAAVVATMWPVSNAGAAALSAALHRAIGQEQLSPPEALRHAAASLRAAADEPQQGPLGPASALSWAAFVAFGRPGSRAGTEAVVM